MGTIREALIVALGGITPATQARNLAAARDKAQKHVDYANFEIKLLKERILAYKAQMQAAILAIQKLEETVHVQTSALAVQELALGKAAELLKDAGDNEETKEGESHATLH